MNPPGPSEREIELVDLEDEIWWTESPDNDDDDSVLSPLDAEFTQWVNPGLDFVTGALLGRLRRPIPLRLGAPTPFDEHFQPSPDPLQYCQEPLQPYASILATIGGLVPGIVSAFQEQTRRLVHYGASLAGLPVPGFGRLASEQPTTTRFNPELAAVREVVETSTQTDDPTSKLAWTPVTRWSRHYLRPKVHKRDPGVPVAYRLIPPSELMIDDDDEDFERSPSPRRRPSLGMSHQTPLQIGGGSSYPPEVAGSEVAREVVRPEAIEPGTIPLLVPECEAVRQGKSAVGRGKTVPLPGPATLSWDEFAIRVSREPGLSEIPQAPGIGTRYTRSSERTAERSMKSSDTADGGQQDGSFPTLEEATSRQPPEDDTTLAEALAALPMPGPGIVIATRARTPHRSPLGEATRRRPHENPEGEEATGSRDAGATKRPRATSRPVRDASRTRRRQLCWNCNEFGHGFPTCPEDLVLFCRRCGRHGFTVRDCPRCQDKWRAAGPYVASLGRNIPRSIDLQGEFRKLPEALKNP